MIELHRCPSCSSRAVLCDIDSNVGPLWTAECSRESCDEFNAHPWFKTEEAAANWWNERARQMALILPPLTAGREGST